MKISELQRKFSEKIRQKKVAECQRTAKTYEASARSFNRFVQSKMLGNASISATLIKDYENYLRHERGLCLNAVSFYMTTLRAVSGLDVFKEVFIGNERTTKRALSREDMERIVSADLHGKMYLERSRLIFLIIYLLQGISFVDLANLKKKDLNAGRLTYRRRKTNQTISIKWTEKMQDVLNQLGESGNEYLVPILKGEVTDFNRQYQSCATIFNRHLKEIAKAAGLEISLTSYVARHTWATDAYREEIDIATIGASLGHTSERTTRIYLAELDMSQRVDRANEITTEWLNTKKLVSPLETNSVMQKYETQLFLQNKYATFLMHLYNFCFNSLIIIVGEESWSLTERRTIIVKMYFLTGYEI